MTAKKEILGIDLLRFFAASMVMMLHLGFGGFWGDAPILAKMLQSREIAYYIAPFSYFGWVGVNIFFVISGFVIAYSAETASAFSFFRSRFVRLMPGVWICSIICIPYVLWVQGQNFSSLTHLFARSVFLFPSGPWLEGVMWTLTVEISFYSVVFFLIYIKAFKYIGAVAAFIGSYSTLYWIVYGCILLMPQSSWPLRFIEWPWRWYALLSLSHHGCFFAIGVLLWLALIKQQYGWRLWILPFFVFAAYIETYSSNATKINDTNILQSAVVPFSIWLLSMALIVCSVLYNDRLLAKFGRYAAFIRWVGKATYPLYLLHRPVASIVIYLAILAHVGQYVAWFSGVCAALLVVALVASYLEPWLQGRTRNAINRLHDLASRQGMRQAQD